MSLVAHIYPSQIRCNRESPCSHCIHSKIECTHADNRPKEKRTRILLTPQ
jgi:hypothetical protein